MDKKVFNEEELYLNETKDIIKEKLNILNKSSSDLEGVFHKDNSEYFEYLKRNANKINAEDIVELLNYQSRLEDLQKDSVDYEKDKVIYNKMLSKPYFARIDMTTDDNANLEKYYIGVHSLTQGENDYRIVDWRSPIASIFYDYEKGPCKIKTNSSILNCDLKNKRQFGITSGNLDYYIDTTINIEDEILQEALAKNSTNQMKSIVQTIQKEQNEIIRGDENKTLIVQGVAGSGKTAIALHRIAYLLYKMQGKITSDNIIFLSPNNAFSSYVSSVLPDLAEDDIDKLQLDLIARNYLKRHLILERKYEQIERLINLNDLKEYKYKTSFQFLQELLDFAKKNYIDNFRLDSFSIHDVVIDTDKIHKLFFERYSDRDLFTRIKWITDNIFDIYFYKIKNIERINKLKELIFTKLYSNIANKNCVKAYINFLQSKGLKLELVGDKVKNEDAYGILFFKMFIFGLDRYSHVKHLVIDEMQDYSPLQMYIINNLFDCPKTIVGDYNQTLIPEDTKSNFKYFDNVFGENIQYLEINKTYRSTVEIVEFSNNIVSKPTANVVLRHGETVDLVRTSKIDIIKTLKNLINTYKNNGNKSIGIITRSNSEARKLFSLVKNDLSEINLIDDNIDSYNNEICIISAYNSKGLEFDGVICFDTSENYLSEIDKNLLYIACTRALHKLSLIYIERSSKFINKGENND